MTTNAREGTAASIDDPAPNEPSAGEPGTAGTELLSRARILVVDDLDANVELLKRMLRHAGAAQVRGLTDPRQVVEVCLEWEPDLVLLDLHMPEMEGVEVLHAMRHSLPSDAFVPVLMLTADGTPGAKELALAAGAKDFLTKPIDRTEALLRVQNLLETRSLYTRSQTQRRELQATLDRKLEAEQRAIAQQRAWRAELIEALAGGVLTMVFQPVVDLHDSDVVGVEALARFAGTPTRSPKEWFSQAADVSMDLELELHAVAEALTHIDLLAAHQFMSVNVSPATATTAELRDLLAVAPGSRIVLELTEHVPVTDYEALWPAFDELRAQGVRIAVDDAGAGYAGLQHILRLRPDVVKLDHDLTRDINADPARRALASAMTSFAWEIGAALVAEGIETEAELEALRRIGVPWGQGYHLATPGPLTASGQLPSTP
jgi:EAL domain-containing protein (putative c-di-GMP-specific phosphodiesterase class I)/ActR/RegA family two-component response regulator